MIDRIKIGGRTFAVEIVDHVMMEDGGKLAEVSFLRGVISVTSGRPKSSQVELLLHECLHALLDDAGIEMPDDDEESLVRTLAPRLAALLADNPQAIHEMLDMLR